MIMALAMTIPAMGQGRNVVTDTLIVKGNCVQCKNRIESAAYGKGVRRADWSKETGQLILIYRPDRTELSQIEERILKAGHETENQAADSQAYERLPACCQYKTIGVH